MKGTTKHSLLNEKTKLRKIEMKKRNKESIVHSGSNILQIHDDKALNQLQVKKIVGIKNTKTIANYKSKHKKRTKLGDFGTSKQSCKISWIWRVKKLKGWGKKFERTCSFAKLSSFGVNF